MKNKRERRDKKGLRVLPGEGRRFASLRQSLVFYLLLAMAAALIVQFSYHWLGGQFLAWRLQIVAAEMGYMQKEYRVEGLIIRNEQPVYAPASGLILELQPAGKRVAAGADPLKMGVIPEQAFSGLSSEGEDQSENINEEELQYWKDLFAGMAGGSTKKVTPSDTVSNSAAIISLVVEAPGFLSYHIDGFEGYESTPYIRRDDYEAMRQDTEPLSEGDPVAKGDPLFKIVNNWQWEYSFSLPLEPGKTVAGFSAIDIVFDFHPDESLRAALIDAEIDEQGQVVWVTCMLDRQLEGFDRVRWAGANLQYDRKRGIIIPAGAVTRIDDLPGVYINHGGRVVFKPVTVIESRGEEVMVEGLAEYSMVISNPELVEEGQRLN